jgi:hypothetical protein
MGHEWLRRQRTILPRGSTTEQARYKVPLLIAGHKVGESCRWRVFRSPIEGKCHNVSRNLHSHSWEAECRAFVVCLSWRVHSSLPGSQARTEL